MEPAQAAARISPLGNLGRRRVPLPAIAITGAVALLAADLLATHGSGTVPAAAVLAVVLGLGAAQIAKRWSWLVIGIALVVLLIPNEGRYAITGLPVKLEPYRLLVGAVLAGWVVSLLIDPRVRLRATKLEGPLALIAVAVLGSELLNPARVSEVTTHAVKQLWLLGTFIVFLYAVVSVVHKRVDVERLMTTLVAAGCVVAVGAAVQRKTGFNFFDHLHTLLPIFHYTPLNNALERGGHIRATASAGQPIELSATMAMLVPLAIYFAITRRKRIWYGAAALLVLGDFAGGSRTGIVGLLAILLVFLFLRPRQTLKAWPALIPLAVVVHFFAPGAIGNTLQAFFPKEGLIASQTRTFIGRGGKTEDATRLSRIGPILHGEYAEHNPLFGDGYGTRVVAEPVAAKNNAIILDDQWLGTLVETGIVGVIGWLWLLSRVIRRLGARAKLERGTREGWLPVVLAASLAAFAASIATYDAFGFVQAQLTAFLLMACASVILWLPPRELSRTTEGKQMSGGS